LNHTPANDHARRFLAAVRGIEAHHVAAALDSMLSTLPLCSRKQWRSNSKGAMACEYGSAMEQPAGASEHGQHLRRLDLETLAQRARARAEGRAGWANIGTQSTAAAAPAPAPTTAEIAAEAFKAPILVGMRQELHDVSRSLLRTQDKLRAAEQRARFLQEHNAALLALVQQAVAPGHRRTRAHPSGRLAGSCAACRWPIPA
jgi:hypothetical protein